ncbi:MAG: hypothetical protein R2684_16175, partial [Pyrinomonadaceae bacterium]
MRTNKSHLWIQRFLAGTVFTALFVAQLHAGVGATRVSLSDSESKLAEAITVEMVRKYAEALSADDMEGRGTMQPGGEKAAEYIAEQLKALGAKPAGEKGTYFQTIGFKETVYTEETGIELDTGSLKNGVDFGVAPFGKTEGSVEGDLVFISYGIVAESIKRNDLEGLNLSGKIAVMMEGPPKNIPKKAWDEQEATMFYMVNAVRSGAKALIYIDNGREKDPPSLMADYFSRRQIALESESENGGAPVPIIYMTQEGAKKLFAKSP